ncbi:hypothetical protein [Streptomyces sp. MNP-20]|uniref:hypothetical protein n=1 Tax=Streptomyces sp. MNP-20 TaxID=2721165 RepID=UPI0015549FC0|nr:hypothetical protein [Streptomyces sp. MNP-20]
MHVSKYTKAIVAALAAGAGTIGAALTDDTVTAAEGWAALIAVLGALGFTWAVPNKPSAPDA